MPVAVAMAAVAAAVVVVGKVHEEIFISMMMVFHM
jgi:hypothetical protein